MKEAVSKPLAIFHKVAIVGHDSPRSTCPSIALLTLVFLLAVSRLHPFAFRKFLNLFDILVIKFSIIFKKCLCVLTHNGILFPIVRYNAQNVKKKME